MGQYPELENIRGWDTAYNRGSEVHHYGHFGKDLSGVPTPDAILALARNLGVSASRGEPGTYVCPRGVSGEIAVYVDTPLSRRHSHLEGIYMLLRYDGACAHLKTIFAPDDSKAYFDDDVRKRTLLH
jgi:hypothetical protein